MAQGRVWRGGRSPGSVFGLACAAGKSSAVAVPSAGAAQGRARGCARRRPRAHGRGGQGGCGRDAATPARAQRRPLGRDERGQHDPKRGGVTPGVQCLCDEACPAAARCQWQTLSCKAGNARVRTSLLVAVLSALAPPSESALGARGGGNALPASSLASSVLCMRPAAAGTPAGAFACSCGRGCCHCNALACRAGLAAHAARAARMLPAGRPLPACSAAPAVGTGAAGGANSTAQASSMIMWEACQRCRLPAPAPCALPSALLRAATGRPLLQRL